MDETAQADGRGERYIRLDPELGPGDEQEIVKLVAPQQPTQKLKVPVREEIETRSNEPGIETLIDAERAQLLGPEESWGTATDEKKPVPWGWFALIGLSLIGVSAWALKHIIFAQDQIEVIRFETEKILDVEESSVESAASMILSINAAILGFLNAESIEEMSRVVRHPVRVRPLMEDYYSRKPFRPYGASEIQSLNPITLGTHGDFWLAVAKSATGGQIRMIVQVDPETGARVDWETAVNYQPMAWDEYATRRPGGTSMDFRVYLSPDHLYSHEFQDSGMWNCYMLTALDSEEILFGYIKSDSPSALLIRQWFMRHPNQRASMILRLSLPDGLASPRGVVIDHARSVRWIYIVSPDDQS